MATTLWYDGLNGSNSNDGLSSSTPKYSIGAEIAVADPTIKVRCGTSVVLTGDRRPSGAVVMESYDSGDIPGTVRWEQAATYLEINSATLFQAANLILLPSSDGVGTAMLCRNTNGTVFAFDNLQLGTEDLRWNNGFYLANGAAAGGYGHLRDSTVFATHCPVLGGYASGSRGLQGLVIERNYLDGSGGTECVSLHDYGGSGNVIRGNELLGGTEQTVDLNYSGADWSYLRVESNIIWMGGTGGIISDADHLTLSGNWFRQYPGQTSLSGPVIWLRGSNSIVENNLADPVLVTNNGAAFLHASSLGSPSWDPTGTVIRGNTFTVLAGSTRAALSLSDGSGVVTDNIGVCHGVGGRVMDGNVSNWATWERNCWYHSGRADFMGGQTWAAWTAAGRDTVGSVNADPGVDASGKPGAAYRAFGSNVWRHRRNFIL